MLSRPVVRLGVLLICSAALGRGAPTAPDGNPPSRPDLTNLSAAQAKAALEKYQQASGAWFEATQPARQAAIAAAIKRATARRIAEGATHPRNRRIVDLAPNYDWEKQAQAIGLDAAAQRQLRREGVVVAGPSFRQSFSVYGGESTLPFITSDSLLNGFHVLLEATLRRYELRRSVQLRSALEALWRNLQTHLAHAHGTAVRIQPYVDHAARVIGPALRLLGSKIRLGAPAVEADVNATVTQIMRAAEPALPKWMGPPEPALLAIDFRRCKPLGFYADNPILANYYRAVRWLQMVPLRASRPLEAGAAALLAGADPHGETEDVRQFVEDGAAICGKAADPSIPESEGSVPRFLHGVAVDESRACAQASDWIISLDGGQSGINDRLRWPPNRSRPTRADAAVTVLAPAVLPDAVFLDQIAKKLPGPPVLPDGLEVATWLGSDFAARELARRRGDRMVDAIKQERHGPMRRPAWDASLPECYYDVLRALFEKPDPAAPPFMSSETWQRKSVQTALAGWAQLRHAWELQAKLTVMFESGSDRPVGFVEPNPDFFHRLSTLAAVALRRFHRPGVFATTTMDTADFLRGEVRLIDRLGLGKIEDPTGIDPAELNEVFEMPIIASQLDPGARDLDGIEDFHGERQLRAWQHVRKILIANIEALDAGRTIPAFHSLAFRDDADHALFERWELLQSLSAELEAMVQKELRGADWNSEEAAVLKGYREELGEIMGYFASATMEPKDDAPRWTTVWFDPSADQNLAVAIGRPRALYVLYPWKGRQILCCGAVMPYYEYPSAERLTDAEWRDQLESPSPPAQPAWVQPLNGNAASAPDGKKQ